MRASRLVFLVLVALSGCKRTPPEAPVDAGVAVVAPKPAAAPDAGAPAVAWKAPAATSTLSVFEPVDTGCAWLLVDPMAKSQRALAEFPGACVGARVTWSPDGAKAVVWFDPSHVQVAGYASQVSSPAGYPDELPEPGATPRAFVVDLATGKASPVPLPSFERQELQELGVDSAGQVFAFFEEALSEAVLEQKSVTVDGQAFDLTVFEEGLPALAHAYRFEKGQWTRAEVKATTTGWDYALGVQALDAHGKLGARSVELSSAHAQGDAVTGAALAKLKPLQPKKAKGDDDGHWIFLGAGGQRFYAWEISGEFAYTTGLLAAGEPPKPLPRLGFTDGDLVAVRTSGPFVLVTAAGVGAHPRLYRMPAGELVYSSDGARAVTFWPTTAAPESHEAPPAAK